MKYSILRILLILATTFYLTQSVYCPPYCKCFVANKLKTVHCIGQRLFSIELHVPRTVQLLDVSHNIISELRDNIFQLLGLESIIELNLSHNGINSISLNAFKGLDTIKFIDLSYNHLYGIDPSTFEYNPSMEHLILSNNPIGQLSLKKPFLISDSIKDLEISNCRISSLPLLAFTHLPHLENLNISNNDILLLHENIAYGLEHLTQLDITNTAIRCEGRNSYLKEWRVMKSVNILSTACGPKISSNMYEKMVMEDIPDIIDDEQDDDYIYIDDNNNNTKNCVCTEFEEEYSTTTTTVIPAVIETRQKRISQSDYRSMLWLSFLNGFVAGGALFSSLILFWTTCCKYRCTARRRTPITENQRYVHVSCETPPPSYNDLF